MVRDFEHYSAWRQSVLTALTGYQSWMRAAGLADGATEQRIARTLARLGDDKLSLAFVAEFSRGKSELINAIFFADYGQRLLPSAAGRTTMCPTELMYDAAHPPSLRLLPIETRARHLSTSDYREQPEAWTVLPLDLADGAGMHEIFKQVGLTRRVPVDEARRYGLYDEEDPALASTIDAAGMVEISRWRHAIINFPHPLLKQGLVILDTPGLNAIGTEPELTLNLIPNAHAVLFILAADAGVTRSDIEVWRQHIGAGPGRLVVLNKIDGLWDELRSEADIHADIVRQQEQAAHTLGLETRQVFPVSAQKGLVARITGDAALLERSRLPALEQALFEQLITAKKDIVRQQLQDELQALSSAQLGLLQARSRGIVEQLVELNSLRGKNQNMISHMIRRIDVEKKEFDASLYTLQATRSVFTRLSTELYTCMGMDIVRDDIEQVRSDMQQSRFFTGVREAMRQYFGRVNANLDAAERKTAEISDMMAVMYRRFANEHGLSLAMPMAFTLQPYRSEIATIETIYNKQFGTATLLTTSRVVLMEKFFDTIASRVRACFKAANQDAEAWLKVIMAPLEAQIRQHKEQLRHRQASIQRIHDATDSLEQKIEAFEASQQELAAQKITLLELAGQVSLAINAPWPALDAAA
ncbi:dynamin family protein [Duganella qianjiadongensis]|uniref:GTPase n=1 Tax=Duganella qianjiadongensis TaxID=2692176 RepID=A0ABW9VR35_9BURK|nr:dynamin family protein [Duganella qianjiadongensis]MYM41641.1 GTPase [Duganella qianjiadongensis]